MFASDHLNALDCVDRHKRPYHHTVDGLARRRRVAEPVVTVAEPGTSLASAAPLAVVPKPPSPIADPLRVADDGVSLVPPPPVDTATYTRAAGVSTRRVTRASAAAAVAAAATSAAATLVPAVRGTARRTANATVCDLPLPKRSRRDLS